MLTFWADQVIIPAYEHYVQQLEGMVQAKDAFRAAPDAQHLGDLRDSWLNAYHSWQRVSMFEIGRAETNGLRNFTNIFPANTDLIESNLSAGDYNLALPSNFAAQGFPALDYLLYGGGSDDSEILGRLQTADYLTYLDDLIERLYSLSDEVLSDWQSNYRSAFIANNGSSASSSVDKVVNDVLFYYEKFLRAGKIGIPAGVFSGTPNSLSVEAPYSGEFSKALLMTALKAVQDFFNGKSFDGLSSGPSLSAYLEYLHTIVPREEDLAQSINDQWNAAISRTEVLKPSFREQIEEDNSLMLQTYDEFQKAVVLLKVDMLQAMNIQVDFVDADGD
jgi:predicted lipoprotein